MKKIIPIAMLALFALSCSGSSDKPGDSDQLDPQSTVSEENLQKLENATQEIIEEAEELTSEVDSLLQNI